MANTEDKYDPRTDKFEGSQKIEDDHAEQEMVKVTEISQMKEKYKFVMQGISEMSDAVLSTFGPKGKNVLIELGGDAMPYLTPDGVTVAHNIKFLDPYKEIGSLLLKEISGRTNKECGDGTTTSILLAYELLKELIDKKFNDRAFKNEAKEYLKSFSKFLNEHKKELKSINVASQIMHISMNNDNELTELLTSVYRDIGLDGHIIVSDDRQNHNVTVKKISGYEFKKGYLSYYFINTIKNGEKTLEIESNNNQELHVMPITGRVKKVEHLFQCLEYLNQNKQRNLLLICEKLEEQALAGIVSLRKQGWNIAAIKAPAYGVRRIEILNDIATICKCKVLDNKDGGETIHSDWKKALGKAKKVVSNNFSTLIVHNDEKEIIDNKLKIASTIKSELKHNKNLNSFEKEKKEERLSSLLSNRAEIKIGGRNNMDITQKKDRIIDGVEAVKIARKYGYVIGGGTIYYLFAKQKNNKRNSYSLLFNSVLMKPLKYLYASNNQKAEYGKINEKNGYDALQNKIVNMEQQGIVEPAHVLFSALSNAITAVNSIKGLDYMVMLRRK